MLLLSGLAALFALVCVFGFYFFTSYVFYRVGAKFRIGSFIEYCIPVYNVLLLCDCAGITKWTAAGILIPAFSAGVINFFSFGLFIGASQYIASTIFFLCWIYLWGSIAQRLGKNFWLWGIMSFVLGGLPLLFLAFDSSMPRR